MPSGSYKRNETRRGWTNRMKRLRHLIHGLQEGERMLRKQADNIGSLREDYRKELEGMVRALRGMPK